MFDPTLKQRGRRDAQAMDRAAEASLEARLRGPHSFPLERLLHIFYVLYPQHAADGEGGAGGEDEAAEARRGRVCGVEWVRREGMRMRGGHAPSLGFDSAHMGEWEIIRAANCSA